MAGLVAAVTIFSIGLDERDVHPEGQQDVEIKPQYPPGLSQRLYYLSRLDELDPPGIAHVPGYTFRGPDGRHIWDTNIAELWSGTWNQDTNGWRVQLRVCKTNSPDVCVLVQVGSVTRNSGLGYLPAPDCQFAKFELTDTNGDILSPRWRSAALLYQRRYVGKWIVRPRRWLHELDTSLEAKLPLTVSVADYPHFDNGTLVDHFGFVSNGPPCQIGYVKFKDVYSIKHEGDYTLTVCPVLYKMRSDTNEGILDRVDLPSVVTRIHLAP